MKSLQFTIKTKHTADALKRILVSKVLVRKEVQSLLSSHRWEGSVLYASGPLGSGTLTIRDYAVDIDIMLSTMGLLAKGSFQQQITKLLESAD